MKWRILMKTVTNFGMLLKLASDLGKAKKVEIKI
jgi:hypothetical protein